MAAFLITNGSGECSVQPLLDSLGSLQDEPSVIVNGGDQRISRLNSQLIQEFRGQGWSPSTVESHDESPSTNSLIRHTHHGLPISGECPMNFPDSFAELDL